jgi:hypothetical protein
MKKIFALVLSGAGLLSLTSCITSLQPLVSYDKIITHKQITGSWLYQNEDITIEPMPASELVDEVQKTTGKSDKGFPFTGDPVKDSILFNKAYIISYEQDGVSYYMAAALMKLGNHLFMDIYPAIMHDSKAPEDYADPFTFNNDYLAGFTMAKVNISANAITLQFVDGGFVKEQVKAGRMKLKHESDELFDTFIITASTEELQQFLQKYADDERIFNKETTITLTKKPGTT